MNIDDLSVGMKVKHVQYGEGIVQKVSNADASVLFGNVIRTVDPDLIELPSSAAPAAPPESQPSWQELIESTVETTLRKIGVENPTSTVHELGNRWQNGKLVLHPADPTLQTKEVPLEIFFHKIVGVRNQLRVLEQKINSNEKLTSAEKFDMQQYISRCYGSLTTFNLLFKDKEDQFSSKGE